MTEETKNSTHFGEDVFGDEAIRTYLSKDTAKKLQATIREGVARGTDPVGGV